MSTANAELVFISSNSHTHAQTGTWEIQYNMKWIKKDRHVAHTRCAHLSIWRWLCCQYSTSNNEFDDSNAVKKTMPQENVVSGTSAPFETPRPNRLYGRTIISGKCNEGNYVFFDASRCTRSHYQPIGNTRETVSLPVDSCDAAHIKSDRKARDQIEFRKTKYSKTMTLTGVIYTIHIFMDL